MVTKQQIKVLQEELRTKLQAGLIELNRLYEPLGWDISGGGILTDDGFWIIKFRASHCDRDEVMLAYAESAYFPDAIAEIPDLVQEIKRKIDHVCQ